MKKKSLKNNKKLSIDFELLPLKVRTIAETMIHLKDDINFDINSSFSHHVFEVIIVNPKYFTLTPIIRETMIENGWELVINNPLCRGLNLVFSKDKNGN